MFKKSFVLLLILVLISCQEEKINLRSSDFYRSKKDSLQASKVVENMIPMYNIEGKVNRLSILEMMKKDSIPGVSIAFIDNGEIAWTKHFGFANLKNSTLINENTVFTGASLSKPITAIAVLRLVEKGILDLDKDVNTYLKEWKIPENEFTINKKVTLRRLISHNAGIKNDLWSSYLPNENVPSLNQMLAGEKPSIDPATSLIFEPGTRTKYSNPGYSIIQKILMDVENKPFNDIISEQVFEPLEMNESSFLQPIPKKLMSNRAIGYTKNLEPYTYKLFPYQAAGGIWTTPKDLSKFMIALLNDYHKGTNTLISQKMAQTVFTKETMRYVFSLWNWGKDVVFLHHGSNQGFNCMLYGSIEKNQGLVVMTNSDNAFGFFDYLQRAINFEYNWEYVKPEILTSTPFNISNIKKYLGEYQWRNNRVSLSEENKKLKFMIRNKSFDVSQINNFTFIIPDIPLKITFPKTENRSVIFWEQDGYPNRVKLIQ